MSCQIAEEDLLRRGFQHKDSGGISYWIRADGDTAVGYAEDYDWLVVKRDGITILDTIGVDTLEKIDSLLDKAKVRI